MATQITRQCAGITKRGKRCGKAAMHDEPFCEWHREDAERRKMIRAEHSAIDHGLDEVASVTLAGISVPDRVNVVDALESFAAEALRMVEFTRARLEACPAEHALWGQYQSAYHQAMDRAAKVTGEFAKVGMDKYRAAERKLLAELVAEVVVMMVSKFVATSKQAEAEAWARARLTHIASGDLTVRAAS